MATVTKHSVKKFLRAGEVVRIEVTHYSVPATGRSVSDARREREMAAHQKHVEAWTPEARGIPGAWELVDCGGCAAAWTPAAGRRPTTRSGSAPNPPRPPGPPSQGVGLRR
jgi:hypothetical protein